MLDACLHEGLMDLACVSTADTGWAEANCLLEETTSEQARQARDDWLRDGGRIWALCIRHSPGTAQRVTLIRRELPAAN